MDASAFQLSVLNPFGRDVYANYSDGVPSPADGGHAPINYHAYAACTRGHWHREPAAAIASHHPILLVVRSDLKVCMKALDQIRTADADRAIALVLKETGTHQLTELLSDKRRLRQFRELVNAADGCIAPTREMAAIFRGLRSQHALDTTAVIPTPYPIASNEWDFSRPLSERQGIVIGTREFRTLARCHLAGLIALGQITGTVSVMNSDGRFGRKLLDELQTIIPSLQVIEGRMPYAGYLRWLARHRVLFQWDQSFVPGQVAGDALLCRMPSVGGNGEVNRIAFPQTHGDGRSLSTLVEIVNRLLSDDAYWNEVVGESQQRANAELTFDVVRGLLAEFFDRLR